ncbi:flagellin [Desulfovibrio gilichinskyi]|uniref:Flagellin n=1 Tax=Desulfovibrio gilichinskyi TaxID=1519643 RepID=A0A1X7CF47_9BACT|nr:flagellin [Desulfovibrio gilichinskyi]SME95321.1 flagellin [Desulfovibrio gilichinskyi]
MSLVINNNTMANSAAQHLNDAYGALGSSTEKMSSGLRINSSADDAAGLAVRELMRSDISTLSQGVKNANDGISMIQTADGALSVVDEKLIRMKELAEQAATGTYTSDQRALIDQEYQAMASEITRIASATDFNGIHLLNGNLSSDTAMVIHFGTGNDSAEDKYNVKIGNCTASSLGIGNASAKNAGYTVSTQVQAQAALEALDQAITSKDKIRANLGALENRLDATISNLETQGTNLQSAESQISDVDVATEMTNYSKQQVITQAGVAMLSQANSLPQMALQLIS